MIKWLDGWMATLIFVAGTFAAFVVLGSIVQNIGQPRVVAIFLAFYAIYRLVMWIGEKLTRPAKAQALEVGLIVEAAQLLEDVEAEHNR
jgi:hypothetical protein